MNVPITAKQLRATPSEVVERVRKGARFTVIYRSRPAFQIVPVDDKGSAPMSLVDDTLYRAQPVGSSADRRPSSGFAIMRELRLTTVTTTDGHFRQVGFDVLPAARPRRSRKPRRA